MLRIRNEQKSKWTFARKENAVFAYYGFDMNPTYVFKRKGQNTHFTGHGQRFMSQAKVEEWVKEQAKK